MKYTFAKKNFSAANSATFYTADFTVPIINRTDMSLDLDKNIEVEVYNLTH